MFKHITVKKKLSVFVVALFIVSLATGTYFSYDQGYAHGYIQGLAQAGGTPTISPDGISDMPWVNATAANFEEFYLNSEDKTDLLEYPEQVASYIIFKEGSTTYAKNGATGQIEYSDTNAADVLQAVFGSGRLIKIKSGMYDLGSTGLVVSSHAFRLEGESGALSNYGVILNYSGTGTALTLGSSGNIRQDIEVKNIRITASGNAKTSSSARGITIVDLVHARLDNVGVTNFEAGIGIYIICSSSQYTVGLTTYDVYVWDCKGGISTDGISSPHAIGNLLFVNTQIFAPAVSGSYGFRFGAYTSGVNVLGGFVENAHTYGYWVSTATSNAITFIGTNTQGLDAGSSHIYSAGADTVIINHKFSGAGLYVNYGVPPQIINSPGYITENSGITTLVNGQTSKTVSHGCNYTPSAGDISVHPIEALGSASYWYVDTITATQFTIHVDVDPMQDVDFAWSVDRH